MKGINKNLRAAVAAAVLAMTGTAANAALVELKWTTTLSGIDGVLPGTIGELVTTIFTVDNGGSSLASQAWTSSDFVSYRLEGATGWFFNSTFIEGSALSFTTDASGNVNTAPAWFGGWATTGTIETSWAGVLSGGWWNNGANELACARNANSQDCASVNNVDDNQVGRSWTASFAGIQAEVPEPASAAIVALGLAGIATRRKRA